MPTYRYKCPSCSHEFDVYKGLDQIDDLESCPSCSRGEIEGRYRIIQAVQFYGEKPDDPYYSIPLGRMVKSKKEMRTIAKARGWEEVGTTDIDKHIETTDKEREKRLADKWNEFSAPIEING